MNVDTRAFMEGFGKAILGGGLLCLALLSSASGQAGNDDEARTPQQAVTKVCAACHGIQIVMDTPKDYDAWHDTVQTMLDRGARGTPEELDLVMQYLFETMTTVDVNHADAETLGTVLHAPPAAVTAIMARRETHPFKDLADLEVSIAGLDKTILEAKTRMIFFQ